MTIFKTYEGFFDFLKKEDDESPIFTKIKDFLEKEDSKSISEIFEIEGVKISDTFFIRSNGKLLAIPENFGTTFNINRGTSMISINIMDSVRNSIKNGLALKFYVTAEPNQEEERIKDVCNLLQSLFDFEEYDIIEEPHNELQKRANEVKKILRFTF